MRHGTRVLDETHRMRALATIAVLLLPTTAVADWRAEVLAHARSGDVHAAIEIAERSRAPWLPAHLVQRLPPPAAYVGWIDAGDALVAYGRDPEPWAEVAPRPATLDADIAALRDGVEAGGAPSAEQVANLRAAVIDPVVHRLPASEYWVFATDGPLSGLPFALVTGTPVIHALSERAAALARFRAGAARHRPPTLFAYARSAGDDPGMLPAARAEAELAAAALRGDAVVLAGDGALERLREAAYDGTLTLARYVLFAAHTVHRDGAIALELADGDDAAFTPDDTRHLQLTAELVVLSACETAAGAGFAESGARAGAAHILLTLWRIEDAASAQFVAALFEELARGRTAGDALATVQRAFRDGRHGDEYRHPWYWSGWQLWGG